MPLLPMLVILGRGRLRIKTNTREVMYVDRILCDCRTNDSAPLMGKNLERKNDVTFVFFSLFSTPLSTLKTSTTDFTVVGERRREIGPIRIYLQLNDVP